MCKIFLILYSHILWYFNLLNKPFVVQANSVVERIESDWSIFSSWFTGEIFIASRALGSLYISQFQATTGHLSKIFALGAGI